jgi:hypothetical protein
MQLRLSANEDEAHDWIKPDARRLADDDPKGHNKAQLRVNVNHASQGKVR